MHQVILSLGSNIGDRQANLDHAIKAMYDSGAITNILVSSIFENAAMLPENGPQEWNLNFFNIALKANTNLELLDFLALTKQIEKDCGRIKISRWSPRVIDIDIVFYDDIVYESELCTVPHKDAINRDFVMVPLVEIAPDYIYPQRGDFFSWTIAEIYTQKFPNNAINKVQ